MTLDLALKPDDHYYSDKAPGVSWMSVPTYAVFRSAGLEWSAWASTVLAIGVPSAIACVLVAGLLTGWGVPERHAHVVAAAWALATLAWPYGTLLFGHQLAASFLLIGFALAVRGRMIAAGLVLGASVVVEYPAAVACLVIGMYVLTTHGWRRTLLLAAGAVPPLAALAAYHWIVFGSPTTTPYRFSIQNNRAQGFFMGLSWPSPKVLWHLLFSDYRGLFFSAPWLALAVPGAVRLWRRGLRAEVIACGAIAILFLWLNVSLVDWDGGWALGPRYLVPCIPFLVLLAGGGCAGSVPRWLLAVAITLVVYSSFAMLVGTSVDPQVPVTYHHPWGYLYAHFFRGDIAVSTQGITDLGPKGSRAAWNLGMQLGLSGLASLVPLALWIGGWSASLVLSTRDATPQR